MGRKRLRSGFTTGACAAAAAKAAVQMLVNGEQPETVEIPFPDGSRKRFQLVNPETGPSKCEVSVIKDAGDDPDVTNGAEIRVSALFPEAMDPEHSFESNPECVRLGNILLCRGTGVGMVTKPGLAVEVGEPAINPVPRQMICEAVREICGDRPVVVTISIKNGEELASHTLNQRLGILGGLSILGTTGIVRPISADAWTATITASMDVAREAGLEDIVLSTGRSSERGAQLFLKLPEEAYVMMGDYLEYSLKEAGEHGFSTVHLAGMWAKIMKAALRIPQTHVRNGALDVASAAGLLEKLGADSTLVQLAAACNTAREILTKLESAGRTDLVQAVCSTAKEYCQDVSGRTVHIYLVDHKSRILHYV